MLGNGNKSRVRLLLVEDNLPDVMLVEEALREHMVDAELTVLRDGDSAYRYWDQFLGSTNPQCPDLVLLDLNLPKRSGLEVLQRIRELERCSRTRVMITSSSASPMEMEQAKLLGISYYFRKPTHFDEFLELGEIIKTICSQPEEYVAAPSS